MVTNKVELELICRIIVNGAPVLANELIGQLNNYIDYTRKLEKQVAKLQEAQKSKETK